MLTDTLLSTVWFLRISERFASVNSFCDAEENSVTRPVSSDAPVVAKDGVFLSPCEPSWHGKG